MLRRLNLGDSSANLVPPSLSPSGLSSGANSPRSRRSLDLFPRAGSYPFPIQSQSQPNVDRQTLHRSLAALSALLVAFDEVRDAISRASKAEKKLSRAAKDLGALFGDKMDGAKNEAISGALASSSALLETLADVDAKLAKNVQKDYETCNELAAKHFKLVAKEEKAFDETLAGLDSKVQKAQMSYEKSRPRVPRSQSGASFDASSHDKYISSLSTLSATIASTKDAHGVSMGEKRVKTNTEVARVMCGVVDDMWRNRVEGMRKGGAKVGNVIAAGTWCSSDMPSPTPVSEIDDSSLLPPSPSTFVKEVPSSESQSNTSTLRGPRPLPTKEQYVVDESMNSNGYGMSTGVFPPNTYLVQLPYGAPPPDPNLVRQLTPPSFEQSRYLSMPLSSPHNQSARLYEHQPLTASPGKQEPDTQTSTSPTLTSSQASISAQARLRHNASEESAVSHQQSHTASPATSSSNARVPQAQEQRSTWRDDLQRPAPTYSSEHRGQRDIDRLEEQAALDEQHSASPASYRRRSESTASERNFVAKMKERYAEEKERNARQDAEQRRDAPPPSTHRRSDSRVSMLASRFDSAAPPEPYRPQTFSTAGVTSDRPTPQPAYSNSMQPSSSQSAFGWQGDNRDAPDEWGQTSQRQTVTLPRHRDDEPRSSTSTLSPTLSPLSPSLATRQSFGSRDAPYVPSDASRSTSRQSQSYDPQHFARDPGLHRPAASGEPHPSICGCDECTKQKYKSGKERSQEEEAKLQQGFRQTNDRRLSMPAFFGTGKK